MTQETGKSQVFLQPKESNKPKDASPTTVSNNLSGISQPSITSQYAVSERSSPPDQVIAFNQPKLSSPRELSGQHELVNPIELSSQPWLNSQQKNDNHESDKNQEKGEDPW